MIGRPKCSPCPHNHLPKDGVCRVSVSRQIWCKMREMIARVVAGSLCLLLVLALYQGVWIRVVWTPDGRWIEVRYLFLRFRRPRKHQESEEKQKRGKGSVLGWVRLAPELLHALSKGLSFLIRHSQLWHLRLEGTIGTEDPASTAILCGSVKAFCGLLRSWVPFFELAITPGFVEHRVSLTLDAKIVMRMAVILTTIAIVLWHMPKRRLWNLLRDRRRQVKKSTLPYARSKEAKVV